MLIPIRVEVPGRRTPWANYAIVVATLWFSLSAILAENRRGEILRFAGFEAVRSYGTEGLGVESLLAARTKVTYRRTVPVYQSALTSAVVHAGLIHLVGNVLFLCVFGKAANARLGSGMYLVLYTVAAIMAGLVHEAGSGEPVVGASGAINGVVAACLVFYPRDDIRFTVAGAWMAGTFSQRATHLILWWLAWDMIALFRESADGVAHWSHLGGFVGGFLFAMLLAAAGWMSTEDDSPTLLELLTGGGER